MFLKGGNIEEGATWIFISADAQQYISIVFVLTFILLIPVMLIPKPIIEHKMHQSHHVHDDLGSYNQLNETEDLDDHPSNKHESKVDNTVLPKQ